MTEPKTKRWFVIVTGSRIWSDARAIERRLARYPEGTILIHGAAVGADRMAAALARARGFLVLPVAYFSELKGGGGPERNAAMVAMGAAVRPWFHVVVEAFPLPGGTGTQDCMRQAEDAGLRVVSE